ncbi:MAG: pilus assembly protein PilM [Anaerolineaceae bacterium]|nr:pilus assembly protein PilM [Anaerolineaceae bacterium]
MLFRSRKDLVGIDIGSRAVKVVQLREVKGLWHLKSMGMDSLPSEAIVDNAIMDSSAVIDVVKGLLGKLKITAKNVVTSISGHSVIIRKIQLSIMTEEELENTIAFEAEQYIPFDIAEVFLDFHIIGPDAKDPTMMNVFLVAAKKDFVNDHIAIFRECGLTPVVMDVDSFAVQNAFELNYSIDPDAVVGLVNMGASGMNVSVLKDGTSIFTRDIQIGGNILVEEIQKQFGLGSADAERAKLGEAIAGIEQHDVDDVILSATEMLAQEVQRSLDFFTATAVDDKIHHLYITGGIAQLPQVRNALGNRLGIDVEVIDPFRQIVVDEKNFDAEYLKSIGSMFAVAVGLAMRRVGDKND